MSAHRFLRYLVLIALMAELIAVIGMAADQPSYYNISRSLKLEINDSDVNATLSKYPFFVLNYYAPGCGPCESMDSNINQLSSELNGQVVFGTISIKNNNITAKRFSVEYFPTLLVFRNGTLVDRETGYLSKSAVAEVLKNWLPGLDTSRVKSTAEGQAAPKASLGSIPLAMLGIDKPASPMLVTDANLVFALHKYPLFVLMGFADWCGYCEKMNSTIADLAGELKGQVAFGLINAERNNKTAEEYNITSYPRIFIFKNGSLVRIQMGYYRKSSFVAALKSIDPGLDISRVNITDTALPTASLPVTPAKIGAVANINASISGEDSTLRYLDRILSATQANRTSGVTINIFIIDACPKAK
jgi:thioredoxin 1